MNTLDKLLQRYNTYIKDWFHFRWASWTFFDNSIKVETRGLVCCHLGQCTLKMDFRKRCLV